MRKALIVGIDYYDGGSNLYGCVNDAYSVKSALERNSDGTLNFDVKMLTATGPSDPVKKADLREAIKELFSHTMEVALLYFAGHGHIEETGGYLIATDSQSGDEGIPLSDILTWANISKASNKIIILIVATRVLPATALENRQLQNFPMELQF